MLILTVIIVVNFLFSCVSLVVFIDMHRKNRKQGKVARKMKRNRDQEELEFPVEMKKVANNMQQQEINQKYVQDVQALVNNPEFVSQLMPMLEKMS